MVVRTISSLSLSLKRRSIHAVGATAARPATRCVGGCHSMVVNLPACQQQQQYSYLPLHPLIIGNSTTTSCSKRWTSTDNSSKEWKLLYKAPMGDLVTRLKRISITSCLISIVGLPLLIYLKNGTWPDAKQLGMGGFAFMSATGSTLALHFVFGPYVLELYEIPVRQCHTPNASSPEQQRAAQEFLYKATTRSIFGFTKEIVFDPLTDVTRYAGARPFANFVVKTDFVLYCHPELLEESARLKLLNPKVNSQQEAKDDNDEKSKIRRPVDEQDGFL